MGFDFDNLSILLVGHVTFDIRKNRTLPGGPSMYQIPVLLSLGGKVDVITSCKSDYPLPDHDNLQFYNLASEFNTVFNFKFVKTEGKDDRKLQLISRAKNLTIPSDLKHKQYDIIIISGVANEINNQLVVNLTNLISDKGIIGLDLQTLTRHVNNKNKEILQELISHKDLFKLQSNIHIIKGSRAELGSLKKLAGDVTAKSSYIIRTMSGGFVQIIHNNEFKVIKLNKIPQNDVLDDTGSGDIFLAVLSAVYFKTRDIDISVEIAHLVTLEHLFIRGAPSLNQSKEIIDEILISQENEQWSSFKNE